MTLRCWNNAAALWKPVEPGGKRRWRRKQVLKRWEIPKRQPRKPDSSPNKVASPKTSTGEGNLTAKGLRKELRIREGGTED